MHQENAERESTYIFNELMSNLQYTHINHCYILAVGPDG